MEPIINPWIFYLIELFAEIDSTAFIIAVLGGIGLIAVIVFVIDNWNAEDFRKLIKWPAIITISGLVLMGLIPTEETMIKMLVASFITPDNVELGVEGVKAIFNYIITTAAELFGPTVGG